ncbi:hypothetical protein [Amycolatopsis sp. NPDC050768]|uniref:hypothetical protein n=1 Tax=Amycolatopsis sp. NPDC050768 TaxID=3154839 RepID=UPI0033E9D4B4
MPRLDDLLRSLKMWKQPHVSENPFKLACRIEPGATASEIEHAVSGMRGSDDLADLWSASREAWLFEDVEYGQWGLHLLSPGDSAARSEAERADRPDDVRPDDVVLGEFLGDSDLLIYAPSEENNRRYLIALPLDPREDWYAAGASVTEVLQRLLNADGEKYWEQGST